jgi:hypothetical protein
MGKPVPRRHWPASSSGLTSPNLVTTPQAPAAHGKPPAPIPSKALDKPQGSERQESHTRHQPQDQHFQPIGRKTITRIQTVDPGLVGHEEPTADAGHDQALVYQRG